MSSGERSREELERFLNADQMFSLLKTRTKLKRKHMK